MARNRAVSHRVVGSKVTKANRASQSLYSDVREADQQVRQILYG